MSVVWWVGPMTTGQMGGIPGMLTIGVIWRDLMLVGYGGIVRVLVGLNAVDRQNQYYTGNLSYLPNSRVPYALDRYRLD